MMNTENAGEKEEASKRLSTGQRFSSNKKIPAPEPPKSHVSVEYTKNTRSKTYHRHTRHVTEDEKIYETITTTSRPGSAAIKTVHLTTKTKDPLSEYPKRYFERSDVRLVNIEDSCARSNLKDVRANNNLENDLVADPAPLNQSTVLNHTFTNSNDSVYKTAASSLSDMEGLSASNLSLNSLRNIRQVPTKLETIHDNVSVVTASNNFHFNAEYDKLVALFNLWSSLRESMTSNLEELQKVQDELIKQFRFVDQLRRSNERPPSVLTIRSERVLPKATTDKEQASVLPERVIPMPSEKAPTLPERVESKASMPLEKAPSSKAGSRASVNSDNLPPDFNSESRPIDVPDNASFIKQKTPSVRSLAQSFTQKADQPFQASPVEPNPTGVYESETTEYALVPEHWKLSLTGSLHHAQTFPNQKEEDEYESIKSFPLTMEERPYKVTELSNQNPDNDDAKLENSKKLFNDDVLAKDSTNIHPEHIYEEPISTSPNYGAQPSNNNGHRKTPRPNFMPPVPDLAQAKPPMPKRTPPSPPHMQSEYKTNDAWDEVVSDIRSIGQKKAQAENGITQF